MTRKVKYILSSFLAMMFIAFSAYAEDSLKAHVKYLSDTIGPRNEAHYRNLEKAAEYIKDQFTIYGYKPEEEIYSLETKPIQNITFKNIIATKDGNTEKDKVIIVCAHYDTHGDAPGADDNATGVAAVLDLARLLRNEKLAKTVKFITFSTEEMELVTEDPDMGSYHYARAARTKGEDISAVICIDMIGYYSDKPGSQERPIALMPFYPDKGNFIGFASDFASYQLLMKVVTEFRRACNIPVEYIAIPTPFLPQIMTSDNRPFWIFGYDAVWVTDTCIYRYPYMHTKDDTYEKLDYNKMHKVVNGLYEVILKLAQ